jgi:predicted GNAT family acetyltransferase
MHIKQEDDSTRGSFYVEENGKRVAELAYTWRSKDVLSIDHTEVDESLEGKGVGSALVDHIVSIARETGIKMKIYCPFAKKVFERHKDYNDVLATDH